MSDIINNTSTLAADGIAVGGVLSYGTASFQLKKAPDQTSIDNLANRIATLENKAYAFVKMPVIVIDDTNTTYEYSLTITTHGRPVLLLASGDNNPTIDSAWININIRRDDTYICHQIAESRGNSWNIPFSLSYLDIVSAGTYTYKCRLSQGSGTAQLGESSAIQAPQFMAIEI